MELFSISSTDGNWREKIKASTSTRMFTSPPKPESPPRGLTRPTPRQNSKSEDIILSYDSQPASHSPPHSPMEYLSFSTTLYTVSTTCDRWHREQRRRTRRRQKVVVGGEHADGKTQHIGSSSSWLYYTLPLLSSSPKTRTPIQPKRSLDDDNDELYIMKNRSSLMI